MVAPIKHFSPKIKRAYGEIEDVAKRRLHRMLPTRLRKIYGPLLFAVKDDRFYGIDLTNYTPDFDLRSLKDAHFPWVVEKMASYAVEKALSDEPTPEVPDWKALLLR